MDQYYDYEAQKALPLSTQNSISTVTMDKLTSLFSKVLYIVADKVSCEDNVDENTHYVSEVELTEVISE
jgi:hypothetical protein